MVLELWQVYSSEEIVDVNAMTALYAMSELPRIVIDEKTKE